MLASSGVIVRKPLSVVDVAPSDLSTVLFHIPSPLHNARTPLVLRRLEFSMSVHNLPNLFILRRVVGSPLQ